MAKTPAPEAPKDASTSTVGKGKATPSRAEQEAARKRPLVPDTKEAKAQRKAERDRERLLRLLVGRLGLLLFGGRGQHLRLRLAYIGARPVPP